MHVDVCYHFIKEQVENEIIELYFVRTEYQLADIFTKPLPRDRFNFLIEKLGMRSMLETLKVWQRKTDTVMEGKQQLDNKGFVDSGCSRHMTGNIAYLLDFKEFDGGYVAFGGGAYGGRITSKGTLKTDNLDLKMYTLSMS
ncbi:hypothetical protein Tco_0045904 [Tanacetum coccineum]